MTSDPQSELYDRFVRRGEAFDAFSAKRLYPGLSSADAAERIKRLRAVEVEVNEEPFRAATSQESDEK